MFEVTIYTNDEKVVYERTAKTVPVITIFEQFLKISAEDEWAIFLREADVSSILTWYTPKEAA